MKLPGRNLGVKVSDIIPRYVVHSFSQEISGNAARPTAVADLGSLVMVNQGTLAELIERGLVRHTSAKNVCSEHTRAWEVLSRPVITIWQNAAVYDSQRLMLKHKARRLPVTN